MKMFPSKSLLLPATLVVLTAGLWLYESSNTKAQTVSSEPKPKPVHVSILSPVEFQPVERFSGFVRGTRQADIRSKTNGTIVSLRKEPGDFVRSGETLAILEANELSAAGQGASFSLDSVRESLHKTRDLYNQKIDEAEANLEKTKENKRNGDATRKDVAIAEETLKSTKKMRDVEVARAESGVTTAQGGTLIADASIKNLTITAPFSGVITSKTASIGSFVSSGTTLYTLASPSDLEIATSVPSRIASNLAQGTPVTVFPEGSNATAIKGSVFSVARAVSESTGETSVRTRLSKADENTLPILGQYTEVELPAGAPKTTLLIPESSIIRAYDDTFVFTVRDGKAYKRHVALGSTSGDRREILSGLQSGEQLVVEGMHALQENMNVEIYVTQ